MYCCWLLCRLSSKRLEWGRCGLKDAVYSMVRFNPGVSEDSVNTGIMELEGSILVEWSGKEKIVVNREKKELLYSEGVDVSGMKHNEILDLSVDGDRWEGDVLNGNPYGWGVLYDKRNRMVYEGFQINGVHACYGRAYYADLSKMEYEGEWCEGMRWGRGTQYNRNGEIVYDGEWLSDGHVETNITLRKESELLHNHIEELSVCDNACNGEEWKVLDLSLLPLLKDLAIGSECFGCIEEVKLIGLTELKRVVIGKKSFCNSRSCDDDSAVRYFHLKNCPSLVSLKIGEYSFQDFTVCEIESVDSLELIEIGEMDNLCCFERASLELKSILIHEE